MRVGGELMTKVDSPTPNTESWPTWPGSYLKDFMRSGLFSVTRKVLMDGVSWTVSMIVAISGM